MKRSELKNLIFECYCNVLAEKANRALLKEDKDKESNMVFGGAVNEGDDSVLPDSTQQILAKFPTLKHCLTRLQTEDFMEFVAGIDWISPRPTAFRVNLKNGQNFTLTWQGKDFEADISGKKYYLGELVDYQRALNKLSLLYQEGPMGQESEEGGEEGGPEGGADFGGGAGGGAGDFPGGDMRGEEAPEGGEEESGSDEGGEDKDFSQEKVDFESDSAF